MSDAQVKAVVGLRGYGKTAHTRILTANAPRVVYYDTLGNDYSEGIVCRDVTTFERFWRGVYQHRFRISLKPVDPMQYFPRFCELVYECGDLVVVVDEVQLYFRGAYCCPAFTKIITAGRHAGVELIGVTQAPKKLGELLRSQAAWWDVFAIREPDHARYVSDRCVGMDLSRILALRKYEYLHYEDGADSYWHCTDDLDRGYHRRIGEAIPYETETPAVAPGSDPCDDADAR